VGFLAAVLVLPASLPANARRRWSQRARRVRTGVAGKGLTTANSVVSDLPVRWRSVL
jgi:hypothetical protein